MENVYIADILKNLIAFKNLDQKTNAFFKVRRNSCGQFFNT